MERYRDGPPDRTYPRLLAALLSADERDDGLAVPDVPAPEALAPDALASEAQDLGEVLRGQLAARIVFDPSRLATAANRDGAADAAGSLRSLGDLLADPNPPLELLELTKEFAKASDGRSDAPLPPPVATVLYYAAILAALLRHGRRITRLPDRALRDGVAWALRRPWLDAGTRRLFREAAERLDVARPPFRWRRGT